MATPGSPYPVDFQADYQAERSRLTTFFRLLVAIPWLIVAIVYAIAAFFTAIATWFVVIVTGRYPQGLYSFNSGVLRATTRINAFEWLLTDVWPPFGLAPEDAYPIRVQIAPAQETYSRVKVGFRLILAIPAYIVVYLLGIVLQAIAILSWLVIVILGRHPRGLFNIIEFCLGFQTRFYGYVLMLTDRYPPFSQYLESGSPVSSPPEAPSETG